MRNSWIASLPIVVVAVLGVAGCADHRPMQTLDNTTPGPDRGANPAPGDNPARAVNSGEGGDNGNKP